MSLEDDELDTPSEDFEEDVPLAERKLVTQSYDLAVGTLTEQWNDNELVLPEIQREYVWGNPKASRLIESLLLNVPIPVLYFAEADDNRYEVIDGHQRVRSIARFINNEFRLSGLKVLGGPEHRGKHFFELAAGDQRRLRTRVIRAIIITQESHPSMKYEVFERLNTSSMALNAQEIRNSTHRGPFMDLIKELVLTEDFRTIVGTAKPRARMVDQELLIRFLALRERLDDYRPPLPRFLNSYCADMNRASPAKLHAARRFVDTASNNLALLYGKTAFRLTDEKGVIRDRSFNRGLAETQLVTFSRAEPKEVAARKHQLLKQLGALHEDKAFLDNIQRAIVDRSRTLGRMGQYREACQRAGLDLAG